jgi:branched-chain amino acid transport system substrate-binding protein
MRLLIAALTSAALVTGAVACSSDDESTSTQPSADDSAALGTPNKATGTPVTVGFLSEGKSATIDLSDEIRSAKAAAAYANEYLGGIGGHPVTVKDCSSLQTPAASTDCANQMVQAGVSVVVAGLLSEVDRVIDVLAPAGIPLITHNSTTQKALSTPGVFSLFNGASYFGAVATTAKTEGYKDVASIVLAVPAAEGGTRQLGGLVFGNADVGFDVTAVPPGTADMTPQISAAANEDPGAYLVIGNDTFCTSAIKAIKTTSPDVPVTAIDRCITVGAGKSIPNGYEGIQVATTLDLNKSSEEVKTFEAVLAKYGDGAKFGATSGVGYAPMLGTIASLNAAGVTDVNPQTVLSGLKSAPPVDYPLTGGIQIQCNGKQLTLSPNICSVDGIVAKADKDGNLSDYQRIVVDPKLYTPPAA